MRKKTSNIKRKRNRRRSPDPLLMLAAAAFVAVLFCGAQEPDAADIELAPGPSTAEEGEVLASQAPDAADESAGPQPVQPPSQLPAGAGAFPPLQLPAGAPTFTPGAFTGVPPFMLTGTNQVFFRPGAPGDTPVTPFTNTGMPMFSPLGRGMPPGFAPTGFPMQPFPGVTQPSADETGSGESAAPDTVETLAAPTGEIPESGDAEIIYPSHLDKDPEQFVGLKYDELDLNEVLKQYSEWTGLAIMKAPDVPEVKVTLKCPTPIRRRDALLAIEGILAMHGVGLVPMGELFVKVVPIATARQAGIATTSGPQSQGLKESDHLESRIIELKYMEMSEAQNIIQQFLHSYGKVIPMERASSLLITDTAVNINRTIEILSLLDQPLGIREELRIFQISHAKASEIQSKIEAIISDSQAQEAQISRMRQQIMQRRIAQPQAPGVPIQPPVAETGDTSLERGLIQGRVKMISDDRTNCLIVITRPEHFSFLADIIEALDRQIEPEISIRVFHLEYANAEEVMSVLNNLISGSKGDEPKTPVAPQQPPRPGQTTPGAPTVRTTSDAEAMFGGRLSSDVKILADKRTNTLLVMATRSDMQIIEGVLEKIDIILSQVLIEVVIIEVGLKNDSQTGIDWLQRSMIAYTENQGGRSPFLGFAGTSREATQGSIRDATAIRSISDSTASPGSGLTYYFTIFDLNVDAVLNMLASTSEARILSTPIILTTDNKEARIMVGEKRPIVTSTSFSSGGVQQSSYEYTSIGIELKVTPHINRKGFVVMEINQKIDNVGGEETIDGNKVPIITTREFGASLAINDRRTVVVGGLVSNEKSGTQVRVPFLGRIPLLGMLFRSETDMVVRRELLVLMTPYVLSTPDQVYEETERRHHAIQDKEVLNLWKRGWSDSELAVDPDKAEEENETREESP